MDRFLMLPDRALVDALNENMRRLLALQTKSLGSGAVREVREAGNISVDTNEDAEIANTSCDPGDWLVLYGTCARLNVPFLARGVQTISLQGIGSSARTATRFYPGDASEQILGVTLVRLTSITTLSLRFDWSRTDSLPGTAVCFHRQITLVPV